MIAQIPRQDSLTSVIPELPARLRGSSYKGSGASMQSAVGGEAPGAGAAGQAPRAAQEGQAQQQLQQQPQAPYPPPQQQRQTQQRAQRTVSFVSSGRCNPLHSYTPSCLSVTGYKTVDETEEQGRGQDKAEDEDEDEDEAEEEDDDDDDLCGLFAGVDGVSGLAAAAARVGLPTLPGASAGGRVGRVGGCGAAAGGAAPLVPRSQDERAPRPGTGSSGAAFTALREVGGVAARRDSGGRRRLRSRQQCEEQQRQEEQPAAEAWHEVIATGVVDPSSGQLAVLLLQRNVSVKVELERHMAMVSETEHRLLEQIFPRHVLQHIVEVGHVQQAGDGPCTGGAGPRSSGGAGGAAAPTAQQRAQGPDEPPQPQLGGAREAATHPAGQQQQQQTEHGQQEQQGAAPLLAPDAYDATVAASLACWRPCIRDCTQLATHHPRVTLLFADIEGFTPMCMELPAQTVMRFLNTLFTPFDAVLDAFGVYKVETIGDCYMVAGGLIREDRDGMAAVRGEVDPWQASKVFAFAQAMLHAASRVTLPTTGTPVRMRVGVHSGPVVSGVVGTRMPRFCLFGDTVNTASRMESTGTPGCIHVSADTYQLLQAERRRGAEQQQRGSGGGSDRGSGGREAPWLRCSDDGHCWAPTGGIQVKGKGLMDTYLFTPRDMAAAPAAHRAAPSTDRASGAAADSAGASGAAEMPQAATVAGG